MRPVAQNGSELPLRGEFLEKKVRPNFWFDLPLNLFVLCFLFILSFVRLIVCKSVCLCVCLSVRISVCLSACLSVWHSYDCTIRMSIFLLSVWWYLQLVTPPVLRLTGTFILQFINYYLSLLQTINGSVILFSWKKWLFWLQEEIFIKES